MKIYADPTKGWFHGLGDVVCFAWLGEGIKQAHVEVEFYASGWHREVLELFGQKITENPEGATFTNEGYETAVKTNSPLNYIEWIAHHLGIKEKPVRPKISPNPYDRETGRRAAGDVIIFPHGVWEPRIWPKSYFSELGYLLQREGYKVRFAMKERDYAFFMPFHSIVGKSYAFVASAIQASKLVIGNDSGPAHFAGTIGTRTISIHGPTQGNRIYGHLPEVIPFEKKSLDCHGCHCLPEIKGKPAWRHSCEVGCHQLYRTFPEEVFELARSLLGKPTVDLEMQRKLCKAA
jgi:ADP-heptose:LPS heptosyltransferase